MSVDTQTETTDKITYLQMVQSTIDRMSTTSAIFKGFCATIITGISAVSFTDINEWILLLGIIPVLCFFVLDMYYLRLEKRFRFLYKSIRKGEKEIDFALEPPKAKDIPTKEASIKQCLKSPSIYLFYPMLIVISVLVVVFKFTGVV